MALNAIKVLIVDDSVFFRTALQKALAGNDRITVVGTANCARDAERKIEELKPDVLTLDVEMPDMNGIDFMKKLMQTNPLPVVLVSSMQIRLFEALHAGAVDFVRKSSMQNGADFQSFCAELAAKIKIAASAKVRVSKTAEKPVAASGGSILIPPIKALTRYHLVAIGASTGGTEATLEVLQQLPENIPGTVITQHMPVGFTQMYAERLNRLCKFTVTEAKNGDRVERGHAFIAAGDKHMTVRKDAGGYYLYCAAGEKVSGHCPSVDVLFDSVAKAAGRDAVGVILTGMGRDGASGLLNMRKAGAHTIGQDKASCVVYGMPMVAFDIGAVEKQAPCTAIAGLIVQALNR